MEKTEASYENRLSVPIPRRRLLGQMGLEFTTQSPEIDESAFHGRDARDLVETLSREKARWVARQRDPRHPGHRGGHCGGPGRGHPGQARDGAEAEAMLAALSGRDHQVFTGVTLCQGDRILTQAEETQVTFRPLTGQEIRQYVSTGEPMDKAGAYGIQGLGACWWRGIRGDYHNVMGLPICRLGRMLLDFGVDCLALAGR